MITLVIAFDSTALRSAGGNVGRGGVIEATAHNLDSAAVSRVIRSAHIMRQSMHICVQFASVAEPAGSNYEDVSATLVGIQNARVVITFKAYSPYGERIRIRFHRIIFIASSDVTPCTRCISAKRGTVGW